MRERQREEGEAKTLDVKLKFGFPHANIVHVLVQGLFLECLRSTYHVFKFC